METMVKHGNLYGESGAAFKGSASRKKGKKPNEKANNCILGLRCRNDFSLPHPANIRDGMKTPGNQ